MAPDPYRFDGKKAIVLGGASGIGAATVDVLCQLGAEVTVLDMAKPAISVPFIHVDLRSKTSIETAVDDCEGPIAALVCSAGVADGTPGLPTINFAGQRELLEQIVGRSLMPRGSAIAMVSSAGGRGWEGVLDEILEYVTTPSFEAAESWIDAHPEYANYLWSKRVVCTYVGYKAYELARQGIRINSLMPGPTDTPLAQANADLWLNYASDYRSHIGLKASTPEEQAWALAFLCSPASCRIIGASIMSDAGAAVSSMTGSFTPA